MTSKRQKTANQASQTRTPPESELGRGLSAALKMLAVETGLVGWGGRTRTWLGAPRGEIGILCGFW
jgi:hypothetical protein